MSQNLARLLDEALAVHLPAQPGAQGINDEMHSTTTSGSLTARCLGRRQSPMIASGSRRISGTRMTSVR